MNKKNNKKKSYSALAWEIWREKSRIPSSILIDFLIMNYLMITKILGYGQELHKKHAFKLSYLNSMQMHCENETIYIFTLKYYFSKSKMDLVN